MKEIILGENSGEEVFFHSASHDLGTSYAVKEPNNENLDWQKLKTSTLDKEINEKQIKVVKIDTEGFEGKNFTWIPVTAEKKMLFDIGLLNMPLNVWLD